MKKSMISVSKRLFVALLTVVLVLGAVSTQTFAETSSGAEQQVQCTCTKLCTADDYDANCPVCAENWQNCTFKAEEPQSDTSDEPAPADQIDAEKSSEADQSAVPAATALTGYQLDTNDNYIKLDSGNAVLKTESDFDIGKYGTSEFVLNVRYDIRNILQADRDGAACLITLPKGFTIVTTPTLPQGIFKIQNNAAGCQTLLAQGTDSSVSMLSFDISVRQNPTVIINELPVSNGVLNFDMQVFTDYGGTNTECTTESGSTPISRLTFNVNTSTPNWTDAGSSNSTTWQPVDLTTQSIDNGSRYRSYILSGDCAADDVLSSFGQRRAGGSTGLIPEKVFYISFHKAAGYVRDGLTAKLEIPEVGNLFMDKGAQVSAVFVPDGTSVQFQLYNQMQHFTPTFLPEATVYFASQSNFNEYDVNGTKYTQAELLAMPGTLTIYFAPVAYVNRFYDGAWQDTANNSSKWTAAKKSYIEFSDNSGVTKKVETDAPLEFNLKQGSDPISLTVGTVVGMTGASNNVTSYDSQKQYNSVNTEYFDSKQLRSYVKFGEYNFQFLDELTLTLDFEEALSPVLLDKLLTGKGAGFMYRVYVTDAKDGSLSRIDTILDDITLEEGSYKEQIIGGVKEKVINTSSVTEYKFTDADISGNTLYISRVEAYKRVYEFNAALAQPTANGDSYWVEFVLRAYHKQLSTGQDIPDDYDATITRTLACKQLSQALTSRATVKTKHNKDNLSVVTNDALMASGMEINDHNVGGLIGAFKIRKYSDTMEYNTDAQGNTIAYGAAGYDPAVVEFNGTAVEMADRLPAEDMHLLGLWGDDGNYYALPGNTVDPENYLVDTASCYSPTAETIVNDATHNTGAIATTGKMYKLDEICKALGIGYATKLVVALDYLNDWNVTSSSGLEEKDMILYAKQVKPGHMNYDGLIRSTSKDTFKDTPLSVYGVLYCRYSDYVDFSVNNSASAKDGNLGTHGPNSKCASKSFVTVIMGNAPTGVSVANLDYDANPFAGVRDARGDVFGSSLADASERTINAFATGGSAPAIEIAKISVSNPSAAPLMQFQNAEIDFAGTDPRLLSLTNAVSFDMDYWQSGTSWDFTLEYELSDGTKHKEDCHAFVSGGRIKIDEVNRMHFMIPGVDIANGIYLKSLVIKLADGKNWGGLSLLGERIRENTNFPNVALSCINYLIPQYYPGTGDLVGFVSDNESDDSFDQLTVKATISSDNIFGEQQFSYNASGASARISSPTVWVSWLNPQYSRGITTAKSSYQGDSVTVDFDGGIVINDASSKGTINLSGLRLRPTYYLVIDPDFYYEEGSITNKDVLTRFIPAGTGAGTTGSNDYGILMVSFDNVDYNKLSTLNGDRFSNPFQFNLRSENDAAKGNHAVVRGCWLDFNVDANRDGNGGNEAGIRVETVGGNSPLLSGAPYGTVYGNTATAKTDLSGSAEMLYVDLSQDAKMQLTVLEQYASGVTCYAIASAPFVQSITGVESRDIVAIDNLFSEKVWLTGSDKIQTDAWEVYIPVMKKGQTQSYLDAKSQPAEITPTFSVDLMGVDLTGLKSRSQSYQLYYTTDASPAANGYSGLQNLNWTVYDESNPPADMSAVTMLKLTTALAVEEKVPFTLKYKLSEHKSEVGDQVSLNAFYANYSEDGGKTMKYTDGLYCTPISYTLTDMAVTGQVWKETDYNSTLDTNDTLYQNAEVKLLDAQGNTVSTAKSNNKGTYSLAMPHDGAWTVEFVTPDGMKLVKAKENGNPAIDSAFNRTTAKTDINFTADYAKNAYTQANVNAGIYDKPVITVTPGSTSIHVTDTKAGTVAATVTNRVPSTQVSYALKKGEAADIAKVNDLGNESADFDGLKTGTVKCVASIDDGYGSTETTEFDVNVYANVKYDANTGSGTYTDSNNYLPTDDVTVYDGSAFSKTGYTIKEFNEKADGTGTAHAFNSTFKTGAVTSDVTLYAVWEVNTYTVKLNTNGGTIAAGKDVTSYTYGKGATLPTAADVTMTGYTFEGWYDNAALSGNPVTSISTTAIGNKEYWAKWTANTYTVKLNTNGGTIASGKDVTSYTYGVGATLPTAVDVTKTGYTFEGWYDNAQLSGSAVTNITTTDIGNKEYWAKWTANTYKVTLDANGGTIAAGKDVTSYTYGVGAALPTAADVTKTGYTFDGWYDNAQFSGSAVTDITATDLGDKAYYAKWTANTYKVTLNTNGGTIAAGKDVTSYTYGVGAALPSAADVTKTGYTFDGWYDNAQLSGSAVTDITKTDIGDKTYYAKWTANAYTVTLNANGGTIAAGRNVTTYTYGVGAALPTAADVTRDGYTFGGWYDNAALTGNAVTNITATDIGNKTYWAMWTANPAPYIPVPADDGGNTPATTPRTTNTTVKTQKTTEIDDIEAPAAQTKVEPGHLCMLDLLFILFNVIMTIIMLVLWRKRTQVIDDTVERLARRKYTFIAAVVVLVASIIAFFLTEDLSGVVTFAATCPYLWIYIGFAAITLILFIVNVTAKFKKTE